jgi:hypothetical protein
MNSRVKVNVYYGNWTFTHTRHKDTEQSTAVASITFDGVTWTD